MPESIDRPAWLSEMFADAPVDLLQLLDAAVANASLLRSDYATIRDWLEIADYRTHPTLPALLLILLLALEEGSVCVELAEDVLARRLVELVGVDDAHAWAGRVLADLDADPCARLIGTTPRDARPLILHAEGSRKFLYFQKYLQAELTFRAQLNRRLAAPPPVIDSAQLGSILRGVLIETPLRLADGRPMSLDREQVWAVGVALARRQTIISGGPGTGKTSIVLTLLRCLVRLGHDPQRIALAAPTGRAAQRLTDALRLGLATLPTPSAADASLHGLAATTLHQLLAYRPSRNLFTRHAENPIPADVVIIDEASMIGLGLMAQLFQAVAPETHLILLGDRDQLPSVDAGAVLANLTAAEVGTTFSPDLADALSAAWPEGEWPCSAEASTLRDLTVMLRTNHRSQPDIRAAAQAIKARDASLLDRLPPLRPPHEADLEPWWNELEAVGGCRLLEQTHATPHEIRVFVQHWVERAVFGSQLAGHSFAELVRLVEDAEDGPQRETHLRDLFALADRFRLLTLVREGPWGCVDINRVCEQLLRPRLDVQARTGPFGGAPVLVTRNDAAHGLFNGDVGIALRRQGNLAVVFPRQDRFVWLAADSLPSHEPGFALTVHKSQGSEYANVLVVVPPEGGRRLLTKELLYTAITRAKSLAVLCGTREAMGYAIGRRIERESGLLSALS